MIYRSGIICIRKMAEANSMQTRIKLFVPDKPKRSLPFMLIISWAGLALPYWTLSALAPSMPFAAKVGISLLGFFSSTGVSIALAGVKLIKADHSSALKWPFNFRYIIFFALFFIIVGPKIAIALLVIIAPPPAVFDFSDFHWF